MKLRLTEREEGVKQRLREQSKESERDEEQAKSGEAKRNRKCDEREREFI